jgi:hypothetical protein
VNGAEPVEQGGLVVLAGDARMVDDPIRRRGSQRAGDGAVLVLSYQEKGAAVGEGALGAS